MLCPAHSRLRYIFVMLIIIGIPFIGGCTDRDNSEEIRIMREWANLAPLPETTDVKVETKGSSFTREFVVTFTATGTPGA